MVDNCQHVSMTCCTNLSHFCRQVGAAGLFRVEREVVFLSPEGKVSRLRAAWLPAPFHLALSFLAANYLTFTEKLRVAYGLACLRSPDSEIANESVESWLLRHGQTPRTIERYWGTVLISALNEQLGRMDVSHARKVFLDGFLRNRRGFQMEIPLVPLGELYGKRLENWLDEKQVRVRLSTGVRSIETDAEGHVTGVILRSGETVAADFIVVAVPFNRVEAILGESLVDAIPGLSRLDDFESSPITGIHLWFDRQVCPFEHVVTVGRRIHWVFNHSALQGRSPSEVPEGQYLQVVISASYDLLKLDKSAILKLVLDELFEIWPESREAKLLRWWVVTEHGATFAVRPGVDSIRPDQKTPIDGLYLAGDWTNTGWPATMEGAVRSGYLAAEGILGDLGRPRRLVQPELKPGLLSRWLLRPPSRFKPKVEPIREEKRAPGSLV